MDMGNRHLRKVLERFNISCRIDQGRGSIRRIRCRGSLRQKTAAMDDALRRDYSFTATCFDRLSDAMKRMFAEQLQYLNELSSSW